MVIVDAFAQLPQVKLERGQLRHGIDVDQVHKRRTARLA
jgi:hypothetical protein